VKLDLSEAKSHVEQVADAVLYEGYILYPYRASATKNQQRWNFGALCPPAYAIVQKGTEHSIMQTQCLVQVNSDTKLNVKVRFLQLSLREVCQVVAGCNSLECGHIKNLASQCFEAVRAMELNGRILQMWQEAVEREIAIADLDFDSIIAEKKQVTFHFPADRSTEDLVDLETGRLAAMFVRSQEAIEGCVEISARYLQEDDEHGRLRLSVVVYNETPLHNSETATRDDALMRSTISTHTILQIMNGEFISLLDPPEEYRLAALQCVNIGTYPVLVGREGAKDCMLSSPIILYDYPQIAPQSAGDLYDGTEIDEILTLRIMTLSEDEKREMRSVDERARHLLERTETMQAEQLMKMHGVMKRT
jgi:hydrogenase maturation protease